MFEYFIENDLISHNQSGFKCGDSCINQLLSITHEIYKSLDESYEIRVVFVDKSKTFDNVWLEGVLHKLKVLCYLQFLKNTKFVRIVLDHF